MCQVYNSKFTNLQCYIYNTKLQCPKCTTPRAPHSTAMSDRPSQNVSFTQIMANMANGEYHIEHLKLS